MQSESSNRAEIESALDLIDKAVAAGDLIVDEAGSPRPANEGQNLAALDRQREERHSQIDSDATDQERIILGQVLAGQRDNSSKWAKFRSTLGLARVRRSLIISGQRVRYCESPRKLTRHSMAAATSNN